MQFLPSFFTLISTKSAKITDLGFPRSPLGLCWWSCSWQASWFCCSKSVETIFCNEQTKENGPYGEYSYKRFICALYQAIHVLFCFVFCVFVGYCWKFIRGRNCRIKRNVQNAWHWQQWSYHIRGTKNWLAESWRYFDGLRNQCSNGSSKCFKMITTYLLPVYITFWIEFGLQTALMSLSHSQNVSHGRMLRINSLVFSLILHGFEHQISFNCVPCFGEERKHIMRIA